MKEIYAAQKLTSALRAELVRGEWGQDMYCSIYKEKNVQHFHWIKQSLKQAEDLMSSWL